MIAQTILMQLGGRRFVAFTGSKQLTDMGNGLRMNLARNKTSANRLDIIYLRRLRDYAPTSEHRADFSARYFLSVSRGRRTKKVAKKPKPNILQMYKKIRKRTCG